MDPNSPNFDPRVLGSTNVPLYYQHYPRTGSVLTDDTSYGVPAGGGASVYSNEPNYYHHEEGNSGVYYPTAATGLDHHQLLQQSTATSTSHHLGSSAWTAQPHQHHPQDLGSAPFQSTTFDTKCPSGFYYPVDVLQAHTIGGDPITAVAFDDVYAAMYVATPSQSLSGGRRAYNDRKASMLVTHSTLDGMLYSSVAGHPEADVQVLNSVYEVLYGSSSASSTIKGSQQPRHIPSHAYRPPYGAMDPAAATSSSAVLPHYSNNKSSSYQMGITSLIPCQGSGCGGFVSSVSPSSVRLHSCGGLLLAEAYRLEGMLCGTPHPNGHNNGGASPPSVTTSHVTVGGIAMASLQQQSSSSTNKSLTTSNNNNKHHLYCLDLFQGLQIVASSTLHSRQATSATAASNNHLAVTALATIHSHGTMVAGCSDGQIRLLDGRLREIAKVKSHSGGVIQVAASQDGTLIATTGFGSRGSYMNSIGGGGGGGLYGFPDPSVLVYDIRYLGRGGIPHPFSGMRGGPRFLSFIPDVRGQPNNRLLVASGQAGGGLQIMVPFQEALDNPAAFIVPQLDRDCITSMCVCEEDLALGTSQGTVLQYRLSGYSPTLELDGTSSGISGLGARLGAFQSSLSPSGSVRSAGGGSHVSSSLAAIPKRTKEPLEMPPFTPKAPPLSLEASLLLSEDNNSRMGLTDQVKSIFSTYILARDPTISAIGDANAEASTTSFGHLAACPMVPQGRLQVSSSLLEKAKHTVDFLRTIPTSELNINVMEDHRPDGIKARVNNKNQPSVQPNPNKLLYTEKLHSLCYEVSLNRANKNSRRRHRAGGRVRDGSSGGGNGSMGDSSFAAFNIVIPNRYRLTLRPTHKSAASFNHQEYNENGFIPGWDYPPTMPNAFVPPVLMLFYCIPELRASVFNGQFLEKTSSMKSLLPELGFLFHRIDSLGRFALLVPSTPGVSKRPTTPRVGAWAPSNFISSLATMAEADQLQILDGSPAAVDPPRRPEAFYRFLLYQVDKESGKGSVSPKQLDSVKGLDFVNINEFISGSVPPTQSVTRVMTVELFYDGLAEGGSGDEESARHVRFGDILQRTLCRETRLRAWSQGSKSYETIIQRKIATSLPSVLSLSCACSGRKEEEGLKFWRSESDCGTNWLPELIEIELVATGGVIIREFRKKQGEVAGNWVECGSNYNFPPSISDIVSNLAKEGAVRKCKYRLEAVLSIVRDDLDRSSPEVLQVVEEGPLGHLVLHARVRKDYKRRMLEEQVKQLQDLMPAKSCNPLTLLGDADASWSERLENALVRLGALENSSSPDDEWVLVNGFVVSNTSINDVTSFHVKFKEPSLVVYRAVDLDLDSSRLVDTLTVHPDVMKTLSLTNGSKSPLAANQRPNLLPGSGELVAFDAEFVSLQEEEATLTETGSKVVVRETRYAVARISLIDCRTGSVILDDHVLPRERVVDYLTRFSGVVAEDLDPKQSTHHLIGTRAAYLKLRYLVERGCIFVGHGLQQDFWTVNLAVPASQIIDTVEIYHKPAQRYISLRFLTNFVLGRDMQQEVHDSVEDALAAYELYRKAVELKREGLFHKLLDDLYDYGEKNDWKVMGDEGARKNGS